MADHHDEEAACPKCGGTITFTLWENLVAEKYPEAAEKLMRGELFAYECPHCHATGNGYYPLRFTDMTAKVMVDYPATTDLRVAGEMVNEFREKQKLFAETGFPLDYDYRAGLSVPDRSSHKRQRPHKPPANLYSDISAWFSPLFA